MIAEIRTLSSSAVRRQKKTRRTLGCAGLGRARRPVDSGQRQRALSPTRAALERSRELAFLRDRDRGRVLGRTKDLAHLCTPAWVYEPRVRASARDARTVTGTGVVSSAVTKTPSRRAGSTRLPPLVPSSLMVEPPQSLLPFAPLHPRGERSALQSGNDWTDPYQSFEAPAGDGAGQCSGKEERLMRHSW